MRPSPGRASWRNASACRACKGHAPAARSTSSSTTRSASPPRRTFALLALSLRRREDGRGADLPRERRRSRGGGARARRSPRVPPAFQQAGRHRHVLLSPLRPQRGRRAGVHPAAHVQGSASTRRRCRSIRKRLATRARHRRGGRAGKADLRGHARRGVRGRAELPPNKADWLDGRWSGSSAPRTRPRRGETGVAMRRLREHRPKLTRGAGGLHAPPTIAASRQPAQDDRDGEGIDWATAEALAFGTLSDEGYPVRLSGQDCERGTFSQRHSASTTRRPRSATSRSTIRRGRRASRSSTRCSRRRRCSASNTATRLAEPKALVLWEAQFGDFANGAQVMIDQFISLGRAQVAAHVGLVMLLPAWL
ncbi:MAG: hypothetical protein KatS3mg118_1633 [Paracoccaceae bacterium]|nr:MAG: hypothetical protein KatS3mg118_1633 [Paracoccaceae bacterium]